jgi:hypothetical protein
VPTFSWLWQPHASHIKVQGLAASRHHPSSQSGELFHSRSGGEHERGLHRLHRGEVSSRNDLILDHMESDDARFLGGVEMAGDRVSDHCLELIQRVRFREDGKTERPGVVAAFRGFLDGKDDLA